MNILKVIKNEPYKIGHLVGFDLLTPMHNEWIKSFMFGTEDRTLLVHRGSYKTVSVSIAIALLMIIKPDKSIMFMRKTDDDIAEIVKRIGSILQTDIFKAIVFQLYGMDLKLKTFTQSIIDTNLNISNKGTPQLLGKGINGSITGKHYDLIFTDDICFVAGTKIATNKGNKNIEDIKVGDLVLTPIGFKKVLNTSHRKADVITNCGLTGTYNHPIYDKDRVLFDNLCNMCYSHLSKATIGELIKWQIAKTLFNGTEENGKKQAESIISYGQIIKTGLVRCFIEQYGKSTKGIFLKVTLFITKTIIPTIIALKIWSAYKLANIKECTHLKEQNNQGKTLKKLLDQNCMSGNNQKRDNKDLKNLGQDLQNKTNKEFTKQYVPNAEQNIIQLKDVKADYTESVRREEPQRDYTKKHIFLKNIKKLFVLFAEKLLYRNQIDKNIAVLNVQQNQDVFNIEIEEVNVYYANGILVHNCNVKDRLSNAERENTKVVYQELQNVRNRGGRIINTATKWHKEDAISIMPNQTILTCYDTGLMTKEQIQQIRASMTPSLFAANYELKCIADENALFTNPEFTDDITSIYDGLCHVDAAYGGEDYTAFTIMKKTSEGIVAFGKLYHKHVNDCIPDMLALAQEYRAGTWLCERNADKGYLADKLSEYGIPTHSYPESMNKYIKISTHLYRIWKQIKWLDTTDNEYLNQILDYTEQAEHDDAPDSAASLCRHLVGNEITSIKGLRL